MPRLLTIDEAAAEVSVPPGSLRTAAREHGPLVKMGHAVRIYPGDISELIDRCRDQPRDRDCTVAPTAECTSSATGASSTALALETASRLKQRSRDTSRKRGDLPDHQHRIK